MKHMTAIAITTPGGPEVLTPVTLPVPVPKSGEILVKVKAAGVNRPDVLQRQGGYPPPPGAPDTPGLEIAGEVRGKEQPAAKGADATLGQKLTDPQPKKPGSN
jgi:NADPH:quinone reductase-like Zn-dependent oxidoreductase